MCQWIKCVPSACSFSLHYHYHSSLQIPSLPDLKARTSKVLNYTYSKKLPDMIVCCIILALRRLLQKEPECSNLPELNCEIDTLSKHIEKKKKEKSTVAYPPLLNFLLYLLLSFKNNIILKNALIEKKHLVLFNHLEKFTNYRKLKIITYLCR